MWNFNKYRKLDWHYIYNEVLPKAAEKDPEAMKILKGYCGGKKDALFFLEWYKHKVPISTTYKENVENAVTYLANIICEL